jgi:hypothetical protein
MIIKFIIINIEAIEISIGWCKLPSNGLRGGAIAPKDLKRVADNPSPPRKRLATPRSG